MGDQKQAEITEPPLPVLEGERKEVTDRAKLIFGIVLSILTVVLFVVIGIDLLYSGTLLPMMGIAPLFVFIFLLLVCISWMLIHQSYSRSQGEKP